MELFFKEYEILSTPFFIFWLNLVSFLFQSFRSVYKITMYLYSSCNYSYGNDILAQFHYMNIFTIVNKKTSIIIIPRVNSHSKILIQ